MSDTEQRAKHHLNEHLYFDIHGHPERTIPRVMKLLGGRGMPPDLRIGDTIDTGLNGFVVCVLGDPNSFNPRKIDAFDYVLTHLRMVKRAVMRSGGVVAFSTSEIEAAVSRGQPVFVLGIEGGDFMGTDLS